MVSREKIKSLKYKYVCVCVLLLIAHCVITLAEVHLIIFRDRKKSVTTEFTTKAGVDY